MSGFVDTLKSLHTALIDSREGYKEALADAEGKSLTPLFQRIIELRTRHHSELHNLLLAGGEVPDDSGSFMSTVHRTVVKVRATLTGLDENVLPALIDGEERIIGYYEDADKSGPPPMAASVLLAQREAVEGLIGEMKRLKRPQ